MCIGPTESANGAHQDLIKENVMNKSPQSKKMTRKQVMEKYSGILTRAQVAELSDPDELLLMIIRDKVYNCTAWQSIHPGGHLTLRSLCGKDATDVFIATHLDFVEKTKLKNFFFAELEEKDAKQIDETTAAFRKLTDELKEGGWYDTDYTFYYKKMAIYAAMFAMVVVGATCSTSIYVHALSGALLGMFWQQVAFFGHDLGHNSVTHDREFDCYLGLLAGNFLTGISIGWWKRSHNLHHVIVNSIENDPDIQHLPMFAYDATFLKEKIFSPFFNLNLPLSPIAHVLCKYQHILFYVIMAFARFNLYIQSLLQAFGLGVYTAKEYMWNRPAQQWSLVGFWTWLIALTYSVNGDWKHCAVFFLLAHNVAGILHVQILLSHCYMPTYSGVTYDNTSTKATFIKTQLAHSLAIDCHPMMDWFHGGLQFQVEHHVWPRVSRHKLRDLQTILKTFCKQHNLQYNEDPFLTANYKLLSQLKQVSKSTNRWSEIFSDAWNMNG